MGAVQNLPIRSGDARLPRGPDWKSGLCVVPRKIPITTGITRLGRVPIKIGIYVLGWKLGKDAKLRSLQSPVVRTNMTKVNNIFLNPKSKTVKSINSPLPSIPCSLNLLGSNWGVMKILLKKPNYLLHFPLDGLREKIIIFLEGSGCLYFEHRRKSYLHLPKSSSKGLSRSSTDLSS